MNENQYSATVGKKLRTAGMFSWKINDNYAGGVPDMFIEGDVAEAWCENKYIKALPKRGTTMIDLTNTNKFLSQLQMDWLERRWHRHKDAYVLVGCPEGDALFQNLDWMTPISTEDFRSRLITRITLVEFFAGKTMENAYIPRA